MPRALILSLVFWIVISIGSRLLSGNVYYDLQNHWITIIPISTYITGIILYFCIRKKRKILYPNIQIKTFRNNDDFRINAYRMLLYIGTFMIVLMLTLMMFIQKTLGISIFQAQELRDAFFSSLSTLGGSYFIWFIWLFLSLINSLFIISTAIDISRKKPFSNLTIISLSLTILYSLITGGRIEIFSAIILYAGSWFLCVDKFRFSAKIVRKIFTGLLVLILPLFLQQLNRSDDVQQTIGEATLIKYFVAPVFAFDQLIETGTADEINNSLGRLGVSVIGLDTLLVSGLARGVLGLQIESAMAATSSFFHSGIRVSDNIVMNAHYTAGSHFFLDFGITGYLFCYIALALFNLYVDLSRRKPLTIFFPAFAGIAILSSIYSSRELLFNSPAFLLSLIWLMMAKKHIESHMNMPYYSLSANPLKNTRDHE